MNITYQLSLNDYQEAVYFHYKTGKRPLFIAVFLGVATFMMMVGTDYTNTREVIDNMLITFFALAFYLLFTRMITAYQAKRTYNKSDILSKEITLRVSGKGITHDKKNNNQIIPWSAFTKWKQNEKFYLIYTSSYQFNVIPKYAMDEKQQEELEEYFNKYLVI
jgi:hypothetical protein